MALMTLTGTFTTYGPLLGSEVWTCIQGPVLITTDTVVDNDQGVVLNVGDQMNVPSGLVVYARGPGKVNRDIGLPPRQSTFNADRIVTGPAAQSVLNTDLLTGVVNGYLDVSQYSAVAIQVNGGAGISAGAVFFEQSIDGVNFKPLIVAEITAINTNPFVAAIAIVANTQRIFLAMITCPYIRARVSTAFVGGTVQAYAQLRQKTVDFPVVNVQQGTLGPLLCSVGPAATTPFNLNAAATVNATSVKATNGNLTSACFTNMTGTPKFVKLYDKASAPVVGTDVPIATFTVPANGNYMISVGINGLRFLSGIALAITGAQALADATAVAAGDVQVHLTYS